MVIRKRNQNLTEYTNWHFDFCDFENSIFIHIPCPEYLFNIYINSIIAYRLHKMSFVLIATYTFNVITRIAELL